jgi:tetratricopeptide (TPR) repeat protein
MHNPHKPVNADLMSFVFLELSRRENWLLVLDNLNDPKLLRQVPEQHGRQHVLITTRNPSLCRHLDGMPITLEAMDAMQAQEIFSSIRSRRAFDGASCDTATLKLVVALRCLPLAVKVAAMCIRTSDIAISTYLAVYLQLQESKIMLNWIRLHYASYMSAAWSVTAALRNFRGTPESLRFLSVLSYLDSEMIPETLWTKYFQLQNYDLSQNFGISASVEQLLEPLLLYGFVTRSESGSHISVLRVVQQVVRDVIEGNFDDDVEASPVSRDVQRSPKYWTERAIQLVNIAYRCDDTVSAERDVLSIHALRCIEHGQKYKVMTAEFGMLQYSVAQYMSSRGEHGKAHQLLLQSLRIQQAVLGSEHFSTAITLFNLGITCSNLRKHFNAARWFEQCLRVIEIVYGTNHINTASTIDSLGLAFAAMERYDLAITHFQRAHYIKVKYLGTEHTSVAETSANLAEMYAKNADFQSSVDYYKQALSILEANMGRENAKVALLIERLAGVRSNMGTYEEAKRLYGEAIGIKEKLYGQGHIEIADTVNNMGVMYRDMGMHSQADESFKLALGIYERTCGVDDIRSANTVNNIGMICSHRRQYREAFELFARALRIKEAAYGEGHIKTADTINNLGVALEGLGMSDKAILLYIRALQISEQHKGAGHLDTADMHNNVGITLWSLGQVARARAHVGHSHQVYVTALGEGHPKSVGASELLRLMGVEITPGEPNRESGCES